jgi:DNA transformation protein and related proteins
MSSSKATADHAAELLSSLGPITQKRMFSGFGLYADGVIIALVIFDRLFLKTDPTSRPHFVTAACEPFSYEGKGKTVATSYYEPPAEAFDSQETMQPWARLAIEAALRSANAKPKKTSAARSSKKTAKSAK